MSLAKRVVATALVLSGCALSQPRQETLRRWLLCEDCSGRELDAVVAIGGDAVPTLVVALLYGPLPERRENVRRQAAASYARIVRYAAPSPVSVSESAYVRRFVGNYVATYQTRTVVALKTIGGRKATRGLRDALALPERFSADVIRAIGDALAVAITSQSVDSQAASVGSLVTVPPRVELRDSTGAALRGVRVTFAVDSGGGSVVDSVKRTDNSGVATVGGWRVGGLPGRNTLRVVAAGRVTRFVATATP